MINISEVLETNKMIEKENLDVRTITMGINLLDCADGNLDVLCQNIYNKMTRLAKNLVKTGEDISKEYGIPIVNKRISITPIALVGGTACHTPDDYVKIAQTLDKVAEELGVNFIGGYSAIVSKGMTRSDELLIRSIPKALACTERICSSVNVGSTKTGINMDAVRLMGEIIKETAELTKERDSLGCAKLVVLCNAPDDNPFMAGAFHGVSEDDAIINVGVSGPGVVKYALEQVRGEGFEVLCETIKRTAFKITRVGQLVAQEASRRLGVPFGIIDLSLAPTPAGTSGCSGYDSGSCLAERSGEKGWSHGFFVCRRIERCLYSGQRGPGYDQCGRSRRADYRETGSNDLRLLCRSGYDCHSGLYIGCYHIGHHCRRNGYRYDQPEDYGGTYHSGGRKGSWRYGRIWRTAGICTCHAGQQLQL